MAIYNIILEGPDGVGKSTVGKLLAEELRAELRHCVPIKQNWISNVCSDAEYFSARAGANTYTITDRWFGISYLVYNHEAKIDDLLFLLDQFHIDNGAFIAMPVFIVVAATGEDALVKRINQRGDAYYTAEQILTFNTKYRKLARLFVEAGVPCLVFSLGGEALMDDCTSADIAEHIVRLATKKSLTNILEVEEQWIKW